MHVDHLMIRIHIPNDYSTQLKSGATAVSEAARTAMAGLGPMVVVLWVGDGSGARMTAAVEQGKGWRGRAEEGRPGKDRG